MVSIFPMMCIPVSLLSPNFIALGLHFFETVKHAILLFTFCVNSFTPGIDFAVFRASSTFMQSSSRFMQSFKCLCAVDRPYFDARYLRSPRHFCSNGCDLAYANNCRLLLLPVFAISFPGDPSALHRFLFSETISFTFPCFISNSFMFVCARFKVSPLSPKTCGYGARRHFSEAEESRD